MSQVQTSVRSSIVAIYPDHESAEHALRRLLEDGFDMKDVSIVGRDFQVTEEPIGFVSARDFAKVGAAAGAWAGGLFGLLVGAAFLVLPGLGALVVAGPLAATLLGAIEGALAGAVVGGLAGALISWGVPREQAIKYESQVKAGKFLVLVQGPPEKIERAKALLATGHDEGIEVYEAASV